AHRVNICHFLLFLFVQLSRALPVLHSFPTRRSSDLDVYSEADVEERPHLMSGPPLAYPAPMLLSRISGRVVIEAVIDTTGRVERSEEHTSELQSLRHLVCRLLLEKKKQTNASTQCYL